MKRLAIAALVMAILASSGLVDSQQRGVKVIGHSTTTPDTSTAREIRWVFLKKRSSWSTGQTAEPVDQKPDTAVRKTFTEDILKMDLTRVESHWQAQVFAGRAAPPPVLASDREVIDFVRRNPGAVGYVSADASIQGVKVIDIVD